MHSVNCRSEATSGKAPPPSFAGVCPPGLPFHGLDAGLTKLIKKNVDPTTMGSPTKAITLSSLDVELNLTFRILYTIRKIYFAPAS
jgi:hypothetical protein